MNGEGRSGPRAANVEALLEEAPWLRRLARGLLGDETAAEDLSQDVLAAALRERVELSGFRLRAWLRTVARRIAGRSRSREQLRRTVEERAARSEVERDASERLDVHRRLAAAIERLPPTYRTALVLRYFEELEPREIAERLGIPAPTVRKRLSRGLALLRAELDRDYGGRKSWALALGACLRDSQTPRPTPSAPIGAGGITVIAMSTFKLALLALLPVAALGVWRWGSGGQGSPTLAVSPVARTESIAPPSSVQEPPTAGATDLARRQVELPTQDPTAEASVAAPRLRVVDSAGVPIAGARAASIDVRGFVREIELDEAASAALPDGSAGSRFAAGAPGYGPAITLPWTRADVEIALAPMRTIEGRVVEDGGPPQRPIEMTGWPTGSAWSLGANAQAIEQALADLEIGRGRQRVRTDDGGSFRLQTSESESANLWLPPSFVVLAVNGQPRAPDQDGNLVRVPADWGELLIETATLPAISGRMVWAEDGSPAVIDLTYFLTNRMGRNETAFNMSTDQDGAFRIGIPIDETALLRDSDRPQEPSTAQSLHLWATGKGFRDLRQIIDLDSVSLPHDLGAIELQRAQVLEIRAVDESGNGIEGALAWTTEGSARTDPEGLVQVDFEAGQELLVLAPGYSLGRLALESEPPSRVELTLKPGLALEVLAKEKGGGGLDAGIRLKLAWDRTPFEGARIGEEPYPAGVQSRFEELQGSQRSYGARGGWNDLIAGMPGYRFIDLPPDGRIVIPGLQMGGELTVSLVARFDQVLVERSVRLQSAPGLQQVELEPASTGHSRLLVTRHGSPLLEGGVLVRQSGSESYGSFFPIRNGQADVGPMLAGTYDLEVQVQGYPHHRIEACELVPGAPPLVIELEP